MSNNYLNLKEAPSLSFQSPLCGTCIVDVEHDGDGYVCPCCGTSWDNDGEDSQLYEEWAGEPAEGPSVTADEAWQISNDTPEVQRERLAIIRNREALRGSSHE